MTIGLSVFALHFAEARSLKERRGVLTRLRGRLARFNVSIAEVDNEGVWQRASLAVVCVADARDPVEGTLRSVADEIERHLPGEILDVHTEYLT